MNRELRAWVHSLRPEPRVYWTDFLLSALVGWAAFVFVCAGWWIALPVASLALWRAAYFVHEINHRKRGELSGFEPAWNLLVGIPLGLISPMVDTHTEHHRAKAYGTDRDPEYERVATWTRTQHVLSVLVSLLVPPPLILRWVLLTPLSLAIPPLRTLTLQRLSSLVTNMAFVRARTDPRFLRWELVAWAFWSGVVAGAVLGVIPWAWLVSWWAMSGLALALNQLRTNVSHFYENDGSVMSFDAQIEDSVTLEGGVLTWLMTPVGTAEHALHHLFPRLAYHHLPVVHARLMRELPPDASYRRTVRPGIVHAVREAWQRATPSRPHREQVAE